MIPTLISLIFVTAALSADPPVAPPAVGEPPARAPAPSMPAFAKDFASALSRAKSEGKILLVEFYSPKCPFCRRMQIAVYPRQEVIDFSSTVVWVRVDQTQGEGPTLRRQFQGGPTPTYLAIGHDGQSVYYRFSGALTPKGFLHNLNLLSVSAAECAAVKEESEQKNPSIAQRLILAKGELMKGQLEAGKKLLQQISDDDPANESQLADDALALLGMVKVAESPQHGPWQAYLDWAKVIKQYPESDRAPDAVMYIAQMLRDSGEQVKHPKLGALIKDYPQGVDVAGAAKILDEK